MTFIYYRFDTGAAITQTGSVSGSLAPGFIGDGSTVAKINLKMYGVGGDAVVTKLDVYGQGLGLVASSAVAAVDVLQGDGTEANCTTVEFPLVSNFVTGNNTYYWIDVTVTVGSVNTCYFSSGQITGVHRARTSVVNGVWSTDDPLIQVAGPVQLIGSIYIAPAASGAGDGSSASDPMTWDDLTAATLSDDVTVIAASGTYTCTGGLVVDDNRFEFRAADGASFDFGSGFTGKCMDFNGTDHKVKGFKVVAPNASHAIDFDVAFDCSAYDCAGGIFDVRGGRRAVFTCLEGTTIQGSSTSISSSFASSQFTYDSSFFVTLANCVGAGLDSGNRVDVAETSGCVFIGGGAHAGIGFKATRGVAKNCIFIDCTTAIDSGTSVDAEGCLYFGNAAKFNGTVYDSNGTDMTADPFEDSANWDLRITAAAQSQPYISQLVQIMLGHLDTPGITMNTEAELLALVGSGGGSSVHNPFTMPAGSPFA